MREQLEENLITRVNIGDSLTRTAWRYPTKEALVDGARRYTYRQLNEQVNKFAHALLALGYGRGDAIALMSGNSAEFLISYYAMAKVGIICVPINLGWKSHEITYVLGHSEAKAIVVEGHLMKALSPSLFENEQVRDVIVAPGVASAFDMEPSNRNFYLFDEFVADKSSSEPEVYVEDRDPLSYLYTSGTTSAPKGVVSSHLAVYLESLGVAVENKYDRHDVVASMMPLFHTAQLNGQATPCIAVGAKLVMMRGFTSDSLIDVIEGEKATLIFGLPFMFRELLDNPRIEGADVSSLRIALYAMAPMPDALLRKCLEVLKCEFTLGFGQTEMNPVTTVFRPEHQLSHAGAVGTPEVNTLVGIMNELGNLLGPNESGEIVYRSPQSMTSYLKNPEATKEAFKFGWFHSGDSGYFDKDGILWFEDRFKDVIKTGGENVASIEVEKAIYASSDDVAEVIAVGLPHPRWGEAITAFVVTKDGREIDKEELLRKVKDRIDGFKVPKEVIFVDQLPRTSTGKVQKNIVRRENSEIFN